MKLGFTLIAIATSIPVTLSTLLATTTIPVSAAPDSTYSIYSYNYPGLYIRHRNGLGEVTLINSELDRKDATFRVVRGLAGDCSSFESVNYSGYYLRHQNGRLKLSQSQNNDLFQKDATFCIRHGLANASASSFESYNYPGFFIRHKNSHLFIEKDKGDLFNKDATFIFQSPKWWTGYHPEPMD